MRSQWNREKVVFVVAAGLFLWAMVKAGLLLAERPAVPTGSSVALAPIAHGDPRLRDTLAVPPLVREPSGTNPFFGPPAPRPERRLVRRDQAKPGPDAAQDPGNGRRDDKAQGGRPDHGGGKPGPGGEGHGGQNGDDAGQVEQGDRFPDPPPGGPQLKLVAIVQTDGPQPRRQAVVRDGKTGRLHRMSIGDVLPEGLRLDDMTDDSVVLVDIRGARRVLRGRFEVAYGK